MCPSHRPETPRQDRYEPYLYENETLRLVYLRLLTRLVPPKGDRVVVVVQEHRGASASGMAGISAAQKVKRGDIRHAVIVRTKYPTQRRDGSVVRFDDNACVLLNKSGDPVGTRINGVVGSDLKRKKWSKILSMAPMQA
jgi:large subunit ribosomal protein L14